MFQTSGQRFAQGSFSRTPGVYGYIPIAGYEITPTRSDPPFVGNIKIYGYSDSIVGTTFVQLHNVFPTTLVTEPFISIPVAIGPGALFELFVDRFPTNNPNTLTPFGAGQPLIIVNSLTQSVYTAMAAPTLAAWGSYDLLF